MIELRAWRPAGVIVEPDLPAYGNRQKYVRHGGPERKKFSDPDASWGHRSSISTRSGGGYFGYKVHCVVDTATGPPVAWQVRTAKDPEQAKVPGLLDEVARRGFKVDIAVLDKGYDAEVIYSEIENQHIRPIIPLVKTKSVKDGKHKPPACDHGEWVSQAATPNAARRNGGASPPICSARAHLVR